jgi:glycosyltransferase involved in cell wall biosynthesis
VSTAGGPRTGTITGAPAGLPVAVVFVTGPAEDHLPTVASLLRAHRGMSVLAGSPQPAGCARLSEGGATVVEAPSMGDLVADARRRGAGHVLAISCPTMFPSHALSPALAVLDDQLSVATVSFLSNAGGPLSFPYGHPVAHQAEGLDEEAITASLRGHPPVLLPVPVAYATGPATLLSGHALSAVGDVLGGLSPLAAVADFSLRARRRGFVNVAEPSTYCAHLFDGSGSPAVPAEIGPEERDWLTERHRYLAAAERESAGPESPLTIAHTTARSKVLGVRVLVDGSCLGRREMGTQVQTVALIGALAASDEIERVSVALANDAPAYAAGALAHPKVTARHAPPADGSAFGTVDVVHRPFQPDGPLDVDSWRAVGRRTVLTVLDLISYRSPAYHPSVEGWLSYRRALESAVGRVDAVVAPSLDVSLQLRTERMPIEAERLLTAELGTDHLGGDEAASIPPALLERGYAAGRFLLVMGANYAHKNRDIALDVQAELRARGLDLALVAAGANVPFGSSRIDEAAVGGAGPTFVLPDAKPEERNWLLRHAALVLYPTSAEGFGLVPSEAARFATPTVFVPVGPLGEIYRGLPVTAEDWSASALADAAEQLLSDPALAHAQVRAVLAAAATYTWGATAAKLVDIYRSILSLPARSERLFVHG